MSAPTDGSSLGRRRGRMWLAVDADGVFQLGQHLGESLVDAIETECDSRAVYEEFLLVENEYLTQPGFSAAVVQMCESHGIGADRAKKLVELHTQVSVDLELLELLRAVRFRFAGLALATNQVAERLHAMSASYARTFDVVAASCDYGVAKPSVDFFHRLASDLGVRPGDIWFVDDRPGNVAAARRAGLFASNFGRLGGVVEFKRLLSLAEGRLAK
jgi:putative hydrolase of the HAD superfamily